MKTFVRILRGLFVLVMLTSMSIGLLLTFIFCMIGATKAALISTGVSVCITVVMVIGILVPKFGHIAFGWHAPSDDAPVDGYRTCKFCGAKIKKDAFGNWIEKEE